MLAILEMRLRCSAFAEFKSFLASLMTLAHSSLFASLRLPSATADAKATVEKKAAKTSSAPRRRRMGAETVRRATVAAEEKQEEQLQEHNGEATRAHNVCISALVVPSMLASNGKMGLEVVEMSLS